MSAGLRPLVVKLPDTEYGLAIDEQGVRSHGVSATVQDQAQRVQMVTESVDGDAALIALTSRECRELGAWLLSAAVRIEMEAGEAALDEAGVESVHLISQAGNCRVSLNGQGHMPCPYHGIEAVA